MERLAAPPPPDLAAPALAGPAGGARRPFQIIVTGDPSDLGGGSIHGGSCGPADLRAAR